MQNIYKKYLNSELYILNSELYILNSIHHFTFYIQLLWQEYATLPEDEHSREI